MDTELLSLNDVDIEEGELSDTSEEVYTPLQRPVLLTNNTTSTTSSKTLENATKCLKMDSDITDVVKMDKNINNTDDEDDCQSEDFSSSSGDSSDTCLDKTSKDKKSDHKKRRIKRTVMVRIDPTLNNDDQKKTRFKKYDIWTAALQEEALTENMRGCDVTRNGFNDRNVENYDFSLRYRVSGENSLKRRLSNSNDDISTSDQCQPQSKRQKSSNCVDGKLTSKRPVHERLGKRKDLYGRRRSPPNSCGSDSNIYDPRHIEDLEDIEGRADVDVAREIATKLYEDKDDLILRVVEILGTELPLKIYKETQRIEAEGGMAIKNGQRRRTPGGVFLFLLKHHDSLSAEDQKAIFVEDRAIANKKHKNIKAIIRDRKVEALKKRLCEQSAELSNLSSRNEMMLLEDDVAQNQKEGNLSNPPPSPEVYEQNDLDLKSIPINHVTNDVENYASDKPSTSQCSQNHKQTYDDDFLDVNCGDMDLF